MTGLGPDWIGSGDGNDLNWSAAFALLPAVDRDEFCAIVEAKGNSVLAVPGGGASEYRCGRAIAGPAGDDQAGELHQRPDFLGLRRMDRVRERAALVEV